MIFYPWLSNIEITQKIYHRITTHKHMGKNHNVLIFIFGRVSKLRCLHIVDYQKHEGCLIGSKPI